VLWTALTAKELGYCPPMIFEAGGVRQLIVWHPESVNALNPETGEVYWSQPFGPVRYGVSIATPRLIKHPTHGDLLFISSSWDGSMMLKLDPAAPKASVLWQRSGKGRTTKDALHVLMAPAMVTPTHVYGVSNGGELRCLDAATGDVLWETYDATSGDEFSNWSTAFLVPAPTPDKTFAFNEHGDMILARLTPTGFSELGRTNLLKPSNMDAGRPVLWCHPALANGTVYWRNDREVVAFDATAKPK
jgi:outer membrane protein assembly factor BamB